MKVKIIEINQNDTLVFKFDLDIGGTKLDEIAKKFSNVSDANVICIDKHVELVILKNKEVEE